MISRFALLLTFTGLALMPGPAEEKPEVYTLEDSDQFSSTRLVFSSGDADCSFAPVDNPNPMKLSAYYDRSLYKSSFSKSSKGEQQQGQFQLSRAQGKINKDGSVDYSFNPFSSDDKSGEKRNQVQVYLSRKKSIALDLDFDAGKSSLNLSGLKLSALDMRCGSADVELTYGLGQMNPGSPDTIRIRSDVGSILFSHVDHSNARSIVAEARYGKTVLTFSPYTSKAMHIRSVIGAGRMEIRLPDKDSPVLLRIKRSRMAYVKIPEGFSLKPDGSMINEHYYINAPGVITLEVEMKAGSLEISKNTI